MKALTVRQPFASLIAAGIKRFELRSWAPPTSLIGERIAIHAGRTIDQDAMEKLTPRLKTSRPLPAGAIVCTAELSAVHQIESHGRLAKIGTAHGMLYYRRVYIPYKRYNITKDTSPGTWAWELRHIELLDAPLSWTGQMGLFNVPSL